MKKKILACDLDNTLIYSYKHRVAGDSCVEWLEGQEQSFMTAKTLALLPQVSEQLGLVPVTTRSLEQYRRLVWPLRSPEWAVTTNGGLLLHEGEPDAAWRDYGLQLAGAFQPVWPELAALLGAVPAYAKCRLVDNIYMYTVCPDSLAAEKCQADLAAFTGSAGLQVWRGGRKVYFLPPGINKGSAVQRLRSLFPGREIIGAGDSELDLPMLEAADVALLPNGNLAARLVNPARYVCPEGEHFAEFVLSTALGLA